MAINFTALNNACVLYYSMDNADVSGSTILDLTSNNNDGTINGATTGVAGILNEAITFDGSNDRIEIGDVGLQDNQPFTVLAWISPDSLSTGSLQGVVSGHQQNNGGFSFRLDESTNSIEIVFWDGSAFNTFLGGSLNINNWYFTTLTYDGSTARLYINDTEVNSMSTGFVRGTIPLWIGGDQFYGQYFDGIIDEVAILDKALTQEEITFLFNSGAPTVNQQYPFSPNVVYEIKGQVTLSGTATQGATLRIYDQTGGTYEGSTTTDVSGNYLFENLTDGNEYHVSVEYDDGTTKYNDESKPYVTPTEQ